MNFKTIGEKHNPCALLIHAMFLTGDGFNEIVKYLKDDYFIIIPTLDGHEGEEYSKFTSVEEEADKILAYLKQEGINELDFILGTSLGGLVALEIYQRNQINIKKAVIDGAPLISCSKVIKLFMVKFMQHLVKSTKKNPNKKNVFDEKFSGFSDIMKCVCGYISDESVKNIINACYSYGLPDKLDINDKKLIFVYGSKEKAGECIPKLKTICNCDIIIKKGYDHCQFLMDDPQEYVELFRL